MSRTFRFAATWNAGVQPWDKTWVGIDPVKEAWRLEWDFRDRMHNGYDSHRARSCVYGVDGWKEEYTGASRKFAKRYFHRRRRCKDKALIREYLTA